VISRSELLSAAVTIAAALAASWLKGAPRQISPQQASAIGMSAALVAASTITATNEVANELEKRYG
jgi:hypothetical protein